MINKTMRVGNLLPAGRSDAAVRVSFARGSFGKSALFFAAQAALFVSFGQSDPRRRTVPMWQKK